MTRSRVSLVPIEVVRREALSGGSHQTVAGNFRQNRCRRNGQRRGIAAHNGPNLLRSNEIPLPVKQDSVGFHAEPVKRSPGRKTLRIGHPEPVTLRGRSVSDGPGATPLRNPIEEGLALRLGEHLRVSDPIDAPIPRDHGGANAEWTCPRATPNLIKASDDAGTLVPVAALDIEAGCLGADRSTYTSRTHPARIPPTRCAFGQLDLRSVGYSAYRAMCGCWRRRTLFQRSVGTGSNTSSRLPSTGNHDPTASSISSWPAPHPE